MKKSLAPRRVLVVDDDPIIGKSFDRVLSGKGYAVITAANGEEALKKLETESYDMVFADIKMPGISGIEVARRLKASQPWLPVVIVTGYGTEENKAHAEKVGVSGFLCKPLSPDMIIDATEATLANIPVASAVPPVVSKAEVSAPTPEVAKVEARSKAKDIALFVAAPFIGLAYFLVFPLVGLAMLLKMAGEGLKKKYETAVSAKRRSATRGIARMIAAPFIGLAFIVALPVIGVGLLLWFGGKALTRAGTKTPKGGSRSEKE